MGEIWTEGVKYIIPQVKVLLLSFLLLGLGYLGVAVAYHVQTHKVGRPRSGAGPGDDAYDLTGQHVAAAFEYLFSHIDELVGIAKAIAEDGVGTP